MKNENTIITPGTGSLLIIALSTASLATISGIAVVTKLAPVVSLIGRTALS